MEYDKLTPSGLDFVFMKKPQKKKKKAKTDSQTTKQVDLKEENERRVDYGGLPGRNLKKNLGCG